MLIRRRAVSSRCASFAIMRSSRAIASSRFRNCTTSGASASHTSNGSVSSQASISSASSRACLGPCAAITPTSVKWPRSPLRSCVRCVTSISRALCCHQRRLVLTRAHADKPHRRPGHRLADRRRVRRRGYLPANIRLHISRRHHPRLMAEHDKLARPMMRRPAGFKPDKARGQRSKKLQQLVPPDRLGDHNAP